MLVTDNACGDLGATESGRDSRMPNTGGTRASWQRGGANGTQLLSRIPAIAM